MPLKGDKSVSEILKPKSPKYIRHEHPLPYGTLNPNGFDYFKTASQEKLYWEKEFSKWKSGITDSSGQQILTGRHYFYLQEYKMYSLLEGDYIYPRWRDSDDIVFGSGTNGGLEKCFNTNWDLFGAKRRGYGWTSIMGSTALHTALTMPGTKVPMTSADSTRAENILTENVIPGYSNLNAYYKPEVGRDNKGELEFARKTYEIVVRDGIEIKLPVKTGIRSRIIVRPTQKDPKAFESVRAKFGVLDELFLHPLANKVKSSMRMCFGEGIQKIGFLAMGGSAGEDEKNVDAMNMCAKMWFDALALQIETIFLPGWMGDPTYSLNGWSDEKKGTAAIEKERERLSKAEDLTAYRDFIHAMPLSIEDVFNIQKSELLPPKAINILNKAKQDILANKPVIQTGDMGFKEGTPILEFKQNSNTGKIKILEHPDVENIYKFKFLYTSGCDPIPYNTDNAKGSRTGLVILKRNAETPVAYYLDRNMDDRDTAEQIILLLRYYGNCQVLVERDQGAVLMKRFEDAGYYEQLLANTPTSADIRIHGKIRSKGFKATTPNKTTAFRETVQWVLDHGQNIKFLELIEQLLAFDWDKNFDLADAFMACIFAHTDRTGRELKEIDTAPKMRKITRIRREGSKMVKVFEYVPMNKIQFASNSN